MNKRIKLKKELLVKSCDDNCANYRFIKSARLVTNNCCSGCKHREEAHKLCEENEKFIEKLKGINVYRMDDYEWWASKWDKEATNEYFNCEYGNDNEVDGIEECNLFNEGLWVETKDKKDIEELGDSDEQTSYVMINGHRKRKLRPGDLMRRQDGVYKFISFADAIVSNGDFEKPFMIATTEW